MYGFIHCALQDLVRRYHGEGTWNKILSVADFELEGGSFLIHRVYTDKETLRLVDAACQVLELSLDVVLEKFGEHFFFYCRQSGYDRILKVLGRTLSEFLANLDALHDHLGSIYPGMRAPSFRTTERKDGALLLHYYSKRKGMGRIVIGIVKAVAEQLLNTSLSVEELKDDAELKDATDNNNMTKYGTSSDSKEIQEHENADGRENESYYTVFVINELRKVSDPVPTTTGLDPVLYSNVIGAKGASEHAQGQHEKQPQRRLLVSTRSFCHSFPFHMLLDRQLNVIQTGVAVSAFLRRTGKLPRSTESSSSGRLRFTDIFHLSRPKMKLSFQMLLAHINTVFIVQTRSDETEARHPNVGQSTQAHGLKLKGQMIYIQKRNCLLFLCSPRMANLDDLSRQKLSLSDIPLHDATRELLLTAHVHRPRREVVEKLEETTNNLRMMQSKLMDDKMRTDNLLHEILPKKVASRLRLNKPVPAEKHRLVSVLFSDIVGFTALCSDEKIVPMDIVHLLNKLYTYFDVMSGAHDVYKVETIGDAYMVVGGLPIRCDDHAERVAKMAVDMIAIVRDVHSPVDLKPITIRIGIHSGPVMAGVVGMKMPRYCLFGSTVNIANKMESTSLPGKINVSADTRRYLIQKDWLFTTNTNCASLPSYLLERSPDAPDSSRLEEARKRQQDSSFKGTIRFCHRPMLPGTKKQPIPSYRPTIKTINPHPRVLQSTPAMCPFTLAAVKEDATRY